MLKQPLKPLPSEPYNRAKAWLWRHQALHFFAHQIYCRIILNYDSYSWPDWIGNHRNPPEWLWPYVEEAS